MGCQSWDPDMPSISALKSQGLICFNSVVRLWFNEAQEMDFCLACLGSTQRKKNVLIFHDASRRYKQSAASTASLHIVCDNKSV